MGVGVVAVLVLVSIVPAILMQDLTNEYSGYPTVFGGRGTPVAASRAFLRPLLDSVRFLLYTAVRTLQHKELIGRPHRAIKKYKYLLYQ